MSIAEAIITPITEQVVKEIIKKYKKRTSGNTAYRDISELLTSHLIFATNWSGSIQFPGLGSPRSTDTESIELGLHGTPRRFKEIDVRQSEISETGLLSEYKNFFVIGDPGAGKTTTLKRLVRRLILEESKSDFEVCQYPIIVRLKEIEIYTDIYSIIACLLGFEIEEKQEVYFVEKKVPVTDENGNTVFKEVPQVDAAGNIVRDTDGSIVLIVSNKPEQKTITEEKVRIAKKVNGKPIKEFITGFLDQTQAALFIDGLDELDDRFNDLVLKDLRHLGLHLASTKIIVTCRSGQFDAFRSLEGYDILEILPLNNEQIYALASLWIDFPDKFIEELQYLPYRDLADRPLLLSQLLLIYISEGSLPKHPKLIYETIIDLLLRAWDLGRDIKRKSKYSDFGIKRKREFLSELSFRLMYKLKKLQFDSSNLVEIYKDIYYKFDLPIEEAEEVALEIETHTGIIVSVGHKKYEFSHLSLHEYLCAEYIVRSPLTLELANILESHPEPVAVAISLAPDSTGWFNTLVLESEIFDVLKMNMNSFLNRLVIEKPIFRIDETLGFSVFSVFYMNYINASDGLKQTYQKFFKLRGVYESVKKLLEERDVVNICRRKPRSREIIVSYTLPISTATGSKFTKTFPTTMKDLKDFFAMFGLQLKPSHITSV